MWCFKSSETYNNLYDVGYWVDGSWHGIYNGLGLIHAERKVNYLNGGIDDHLSNSLSIYIDSLIDD